MHEQLDEPELGSNSSVGIASTLLIGYFGTLRLNRIKVPSTLSPNIWVPQDQIYRLCKQILTKNKFGVQEFINMHTRFIYNYISASYDITEMLQECHQGSLNPYFDPRKFGIAVLKSCWKLFKKRICNQDVANLVENKSDPCGAIGIKITLSCYHNEQDLLLQKTLYEALFIYLMDKVCEYLSSTALMVSSLSFYGQGAIDTLYFGLKLGLKGAQFGNLDMIYISNLQDIGFSE